MGSLMQEDTGRWERSRKACESKAGKVRPGKLVCVWVWPARKETTKASRQRQDRSPQAQATHPRLRRGLHPKTSKHRGVSRGRRCSTPEKLQTKTKLRRSSRDQRRPVPSSARGLRACRVQHSGLEEGPGEGGARPTAGRQGGGGGSARRLVTIWEPPPDLRGARPRLAPGRQGEAERRGLASAGG